ncbi:C-C motif chemokine 3-like [Tachysurus fulvidraco]|uniref:C-C motif chemokine 3-like n=1 Tax=Tachysurus fulvidraco TaxID=1234273 RepID=UPI001FEEAC62|nr:C-C motif chemokine 3-like [Tachysurus fulvidraco]
MRMRLTTVYEVTDILCTKPGVIFTLQNGRHVCADPQVMWVKFNMNRIDQFQFIRLNNTEAGPGPDQCCTKFLQQPIPVRVITEYEETDPECIHPGVIFTLQDGRHVCADPQVMWVKNHINRIDQLLLDNLNNTEG